MKALKGISCIFAFLAAILVLVAILVAAGVGGNSSGFLDLSNVVAITILGVAFACSVVAAITSLIYKLEFDEGGCTMKKRLLYLILPIITLVLEILPYGAVCNFMRPSTTEGVPAGQFRELYSYFDLTPFGYANFAPLITAIITCIVLLLVAIYCLTGNKKWALKVKNILYVCAAFSLGPLVLGINFFSVVGALITASLMAELLLIHFTIKKPVEQT